MRKTSSMFLVLLVSAFAGEAFAAEAPAAMPLPQVWTGRLEAPPESKDPDIQDIEVKIAALSSAEEIRTLGADLRLSGQMGLRQAMFGLEQKAWVRLGRAVATSVGLVRVVDLPDGRRRMRLVSDFPARVLDSSDPSGSDAHPFAFIELIVGRDGTGEGQMIAAASITLSEEGTIQLESAGAPVLRITDVATDSPAR